MNRWRDNLIWTVQACASSDVLVEYQQTVGFDRETAIGELVCMWGDDLYHPETPLMRDQFSSDELDAMARFDCVFREQDKRWEESWLVIQKAAKELIDACRWEQK